MSCSAELSTKKFYNLGSKLQTQLTLEWKPMIDKLLTVPYKLKFKVGQVYTYIQNCKVVKLHGLA